MSPPLQHATSTQPDTGSAIGLLKALDRGDRRALAALTLGRRLDFDTLGERLLAGRMGVYVHARLTGLGLTALLPRRVAEPIHWQYAAQQQRNARLLVLLDEVQRALAAAGIEVLVLKGLPLAQRCWGGLDQRFSLDLDLLVRPERFAQAVVVLKRLGCSGPPLTPYAERLAQRLSHALELTREGLSLDLHWTLRNRPGLRFDLAAPWAAATACRLGPLDCRALGDEDQLVMLLSGLANDLERGHHRLRSFWDIYLLLKAMPDTDWQAFWDRRADQGLTVLLRTLLALVVYRLACADELPALAAAIAAATAPATARDAVAVERLLGNAPQSLANRRWFARLLPVPAWRYWAWWGGTLPLRYMLGRHI